MKLPDAMHAGQERSVRRGRGLAASAAAVVGSKLQQSEDLVVCCIVQAEHGESYPRVHVDFALTSPEPFIASSPAIDWEYHSPEEEIRSALLHILKIY